MNTQKEALAKELGLSHSKLKRGLVQCRTCKRIESVDSSDCIENGWPKCHGETMTLDVGE